MDNKTKSLGILKTVHQPTEKHPRMTGTLKLHSSYTSHLGETIPGKSRKYIGVQSCSLGKPRNRCKVSDCGTIA